MILNAKNMGILIYITKRLRNINIILRVIKQKTAITLRTRKLQYFALRLAVRETGLPPPPIPHQNPRLAPRTAYQYV